MNYFIVFLSVLIVIHCQNKSLEETIRQRYQTKMLVNQPNLTIQYQTRLIQQDQDDLVGQHQNQQIEQDVNETFQRKKIKKTIQKKRVILKEIPPPVVEKNQKKRKVHKKIKKCKKIIRD